MTSTSECNNSIRFCIRSYIAFVLAPETPIIEWLAKLDNWTRNSPGFFAGRPLVLDLSSVDLGQPGLSLLLDQLAQRNLRIIGLEGVDESQLNPSLPPILTSGRSAERPAPTEPPEGAPASSAATQDEPTSLMINTLRSGQTVVFPNGDVTVLGSVASGSEIVAGGSIHVYGTLRGRAMAGSQGNSHARIFCKKNEAELLAINGYYRTAEELDAVRSLPAQTWLEDGVLRVAPLA